MTSIINIESRELIFSINVNFIIEELTLNHFADYCENEFHVCGQDHVLKNKRTYHIVIWNTKITHVNSFEQLADGHEGRLSCFN